ncbi:proton channel OtopLc-like [Cylas formicarius]|uniref:proton channel OtopLc-like n=1 Tax=Cylas formicarius TaxID=197179 RepID=UPI00295898B9|nr:proton channel OtopLc-like [Cylas formicarius]
MKENDQDDPVPLTNSDIDRYAENNVNKAKRPESLHLGNKEKREDDLRYTNYDQSERRQADVPDDISITNSDVILRRPAVNRKNTNLSARVTPRAEVFKSSHPHSTGDLQSYYQTAQQRRPQSKNKKKEMVLQLVIPSPVYNRSPPNLNSFAYPIDTGDNYENHRFTFSSQISQSNDLSSPASYHLNDEHEQKMFKASEYSRSTSSINTSHTPSTPDEKRKFFNSSLSATLGVLFSLMNITIGISVYIIDALQLDSKEINRLAEGFSLFLLLTALLYLLYLTVDISVFNRKRRKFEQLLEESTQEEVEMTKNANGTLQLNVTLPKIASLKKQLEHNYCFNRDRHSTNFYLKVGAAGFCFGHLIHSLIILIYRGMALDDNISSKCDNVLTFIIEVLYPVYSILLLFFIFKYSNVIINKNQVLHRFGFMHCISASLCFWIWTIFRETAEYITYQKDKSFFFDHNNESHNAFSFVTYPSEIAPRRFTRVCEHDELSVIYQNYSPYLYPFSVEYSILVVGILLIVWQNIGLCKVPSGSPHDRHSLDTNECKHQNKPIEPEGNVSVHADCHSANKGLFGGFLVMVFALVSIIVFFITYYSKESDFAESGRILNRCTHLVIMALMVVTAIWAYVQISKLDINTQAHNQLDNILLLICMPAFFVHSIFSIIPAIIFRNALAILGITFEVAQILIQTPLMIDGMARSSNTKENRQKKPGRELVTFLIICNIAMWLMQTFEVKSHGLDQYRQEYYSKELWSIVGHVCLPLMMFYRFHSSACLGDIWKYAYIPSGH